MPTPCASITTHPWTWSSVLRSSLLSMRQESTKLKRLRTCKREGRSGCCAWSGKIMTRRHGKRQDSSIRMSLTLSMPKWMRRWLRAREDYCRSTCSFEMNSVKTVILQKGWQWLSAGPAAPDLSDLDRQDESASILPQRWAWLESSTASMWWLRLKRIYAEWLQFLAKALDPEINALRTSCSTNCAMSACEKGVLSIYILL